MSDSNDDRMIGLLPSAMRDDDTTTRFVSIFDLLHAELRSRIAGVGDYFDPGVAPLEFVWLLASWTDLMLPGAWEDGGPAGEQHARRFVEVAGPLFRWRGTRRGLVAVLSAATGGDVVVHDSGGVWADGMRPERVTPAHVVIEISGSRDDVHVRDLDELVRGQMPVGVTYELVMFEEDPTHG